MLRTSLLLLPLLVSELWTAPLTKYDQRQDGELNVHAHLENFVILLIPGGGGLFNIAAKIAPGKHHGGKHVKGTVEGGSKHPSEDTAVAPVGIKNPPYKVDIDADRRVPIVLEISAPVVSEQQHEVVIAESPAVSLTKKEPVKKEPEEPSSTPDKPEPQSDLKEKPSNAEKPVAALKPSEPVPKPSAVPALPEKPEPASSDKPPKKPAGEAASPAAEEAAGAPARAERPAEAAKPAPAAAEQPSKQVAQEARARAARLEVLRTGLSPSPSAPCAPHEVRDGLCARAHQPVRVSKSYEDAALLKALRFGLAPAN